MRLTRLAHMRPSELADRLRQEQLKVFERLHIIGVGELDPQALHGTLDRAQVEDGARSRAQRGDAGGTMRALLERFREDARERFFVGAARDDSPELISKHMPDARDVVVKAADKSRTGRFDLLGYHDLDFGEPVDWQLDPLSGKKSKLGHWTRIDPLDRATAGDHKVVWELNRHQWLLHWAQAYAFTRDERYAGHSIATLERWLRANPTGLGVNWVSSLELAMRLVSWSWTLVLLRNSPALRPEAFGRLLGAIRAHATHIARYLSTTFSPNTHLLGEALGLFYVGVLFPELDYAHAWRTTGERILVEQIKRQVLPDGVCFEQSTCYQRYTAEMYMHFLILAARNGLTVPAEVATGVNSCIDFLLAIRRPDGSVPQVGDGDGGWLLPLVPRKADDMRGVFGIAAALFGRSDCAEAAGGPVIEVGWLLGASALQDAAGPNAKTVSQAKVSPSRLFEHGGYAILRTDFGPKAHQLIVDVGPLGCPFSGAHGHADLLSLTCDIFGEPCIVDPGMPTYGGAPSWRDAFRSTALHSSVVVDELSQATPDGAFSWKSRPHARIRSWTSSEASDFIDGEHDAYRSGHNAITHRRRVIFVKPRYWVVIDDLDQLDTEAMHGVEICFQFAPHHIMTAEGLWVRAMTPAGHALLVRATANVPLQTAIHEGEHDPLPIRGWFSPAYGWVQPAPALIYRATTQLPLRVVTLLLPAERADAPLPAVFPPESDASLLQPFFV